MHIYLYLCNKLKVPLALGQVKVRVWTTSAANRSGTSEIEQTMKFSFTQAFLHGETMPRKNHDHDPYFPSFTIAWSMVTVHSLPNGQVNGHGHPRISPQWSGQWLLPSKIVFGISKILEYFWLFIKSFTPFTAIFSFICCKIIENSKPPLIFHSKFCPKQVYFLI